MELHPLPSPGLQQWSSWLCQGCFLRPSAVDVLKDFSKRICPPCLGRLCPCNNCGELRNPGDWPMCYDVLPRVLNDRPEYSHMWCGPCQSEYVSVDTRDVEEEDLIATQSQDTFDIREKIDDEQKQRIFCEECNCPMLVGHQFRGREYRNICCGFKWGVHAGFVVHAEFNNFRQELADIMKVGELTGRNDLQILNNELSMIGQLMSPRDDGEQSFIGHVRNCLGVSEIFLHGNYKLIMKGPNTTLWSVMASMINGEKISNDHQRQHARRRLVKHLVYENPSYTALYEGISGLDGVIENASVSVQLDDGCTGVHMVTGCDPQDECGNNAGPVIQVDSKMLYQNDKTLRDSLFNIIGGYPLLFPTGNCGFQFERQVDDPQLEIDDILRWLYQMQEKCFSHEDFPKELQPVVQQLTIQVYMLKEEQKLCQAIENVKFCKSPFLADQIPMVPVDIHGTVPHLQRCRKLLSGIGRFHGNPLIFLTLTPSECNYERPWETMRSFRGRLRSFLIEFGKLGLGDQFGKIDFAWVATEFQRRGCPHGHLLIWFEKQCYELTALSNISTVRSEVDRFELCALMDKYQFHSCGPHCSKSGRCRFRMPAEETPICHVVDGHFRPRRRKSELRMVAVTPECSEMWGGHSCTVCTTSARKMGYCSKYCAKFDEANSVKLYVGSVEHRRRVRCMSSSEASARAQGLPLYEFIPFVDGVPKWGYEARQKLPYIEINPFRERYSTQNVEVELEEGVSLEEQQDYGLDWGLECEPQSYLNVYLARDKNLDEFCVPFSKFWSQFTKRKCNIPAPGESFVSYVELSNGVGYCITRRSKTRAVILKFDKKHHFPQVPLHLIKYILNGCIIYDSFPGDSDLAQELCKRSGFIPWDDHLLLHLRQANLNREDRINSFVSAVLNGIDIQVLKLAWNEYRNILGPVESLFMRLKTARAKKLLRMVVGLNNNDGVDEDCGLEDDEYFDNASEFEKFKSKRLLMKKGRGLQWQVFCKVVNTVQLREYFNVGSHRTRDLAASQKVVHCVDAVAGSGKTFLVEALCNFYRGIGHSVLVSAVSGQAANLVGGTTMHALVGLDFKGMVTKCGADQAQRIRNASLIIIDEIFLATARWMELFDKEMRNVTGIDQLMGGKRVILLGDSGQIAPVIRGGDQEQIRSVHVWNFINDNRIGIELHELDNDDSPRFENDRPWGEFLKKIRRCEIDSVSTQEFPCVDALPITECLNSSAVILCPTHAEVREINDEIFKIFKERNPSIETRRYRGRDITPEFGSVADDRPDCGSLPPLVLDLAVGVPIKLCRLWRCWQSGKTLPKNSYGRIKSISENSLSVSFDGHGHDINLYRCTFNHDDGETLRLQFPVVLRWAQTYNSIQGMTISDKYFISLRRGSTFSHGQLYVLLSRGRERKYVNFIVSDAEKHVNVANIVDSGLLNSKFTELINEVGDEEIIDLHEENGDEDENGDGGEISVSTSSWEDDNMDIDILAEE